jgi:hypothetical protein
VYRKSTAYSQPFENKVKSKFQDAWIVFRLTSAVFDDSVNQSPSHDHDSDGSLNESFGKFFDPSSELNECGSVGSKLFVKIKYQMFHLFEALKLLKIQTEMLQSQHVRALLGFRM